MKYTTLLFAFCLINLFVYSLQTDCLNDCNNRGSCSNGECICQNGYGGEDCSIVDIALSSGNTVSGKVRTFAWKYYHITVPQNANGLEVHMYQSSLFGDIDVYVQHDHYPTFDDYQERDTSFHKTVDVEIDNPVAGIWYIGLYGYWEANYDLTATVQNDCIVECVHGSCNVDYCQCDDPYVNTDWDQTCNVYDLGLQLGQQTSGNVGDREFRYYHVNIQSGHDLVIDVTQDDDTKDVDVYAKFNDYPNSVSFDYLNATLAPDTHLYINEPSAGTWYIGVYGYKGDSYEITVTSTILSGSCENACSNHGNCISNTCSCNNGYEGDSCEILSSPMVINQSYEGYVFTNNWNYFQLDSATQNNLVVHIAQLNEGDCDLYIKHDEKPTRISYDLADLSYDEEFDITIQQPGIETWWIGVYGWQTCQFDIYYSEEMSCACGNSSHGHCNDNSDVCICDQGWTGVACDEYGSSLSNGEIRSHQTVEKNSWKYYEITVDSSAIIITVLETNTVGFLELFVSLDGFPTISNFEASDVEYDSFHQVEVAFPQSGKASRTYYIGVYGDAFDTSPDAVDFSVTAYAPPF